jgi:hypothetical protein
MMCNNIQPQIRKLNYLEAEPKRYQLNNYDKFTDFKKILLISESVSK